MRQQADGRLLSLSLKAGKPSNPSKTAPQDPPRIDLTRADSPHTEAPHNEASRVQPPRNAPSEPKAARGDLTYEENSYAHHREQSDRDRRRAAPEFQDGSYGFEQKEDRMEVDNNNRRDYNHNRPRQYGGGRDVGRPAVERRLYSDDLYPRHGGRGFR